LMLLAFAVLTAGLPALPTRAEGTVDSRGNQVTAGVTGKPDLYSPGDWLMRLDVSAVNMLGQPIAGSQVTFERVCRAAVPCPFKDRPEPVGQTDLSGRLSYAWTEHRVARNTDQVIEGAVHVYIPPDWVSVQLYYTVGEHSVGDS